MRLSELWLKLQVVHKLNVKIRPNVYVSGIVGWGLATWHFYWSIISCLTNQPRYHARDINSGWTLINLQRSVPLFPLPPNIVEQYAHLIGTQCFLTFTLYDKLFLITYETSKSSSFLITISKPQYPHPTLETNKQTISIKPDKILQPYVWLTRYVSFFVL